MTTIKELQLAVSSTNKILIEAVKIMNPIALLRNVHPLYRSDFAYRLVAEQVITRDQAREFVKFIGSGTN